MKKNTLPLVAMMLSMSMLSPAHAVLNTIDLAALVSCNSLPDVNFFYTKFKAQYGEPVRKEQGAYWFKGSGELYGSSIRELFVSYTPFYSIVGVLLENKPTDVIENIRKSRIFPTNVFPSNGYWVGADGRTIMWHAGKYTKIFCSGYNINGPH